MTSNSVRFTETIAIYASMALLLMALGRMGHYAKTDEWAFVVGFAIVALLAVVSAIRCISTKDHLEIEKLEKRLRHEWERVSKLQSELRNETLALDREKKQHRLVLGLPSTTRCDYVWKVGTKVAQDAKQPTPAFDHYSSLLAEEVERQ